MKENTEKQEQVIQEVKTEETNTPVEQQTPPEEKVSYSQVVLVRSVGLKTIVKQIRQNTLLLLIVVLVLMLWIPELPIYLIFFSNRF